MIEPVPEPERDRLMAITLKELSRLLELSQTTVSRALNGYPEVSEATRKRVEQAALEHGYRANPRARSLATGRSMIIGHLFSQTLKDPDVAAQYQGITEFLFGSGTALAARGYDSQVFCSPDDSTETLINWFLKTRSVDGLILHGFRPGSAAIEQLARADLPFALHGQGPLSAPHGVCLDTDMRQAARLAMHHLTDLGHHRIAFINGSAGHSRSEPFETGFLDVMAARSLVPNRLWMRSGLPSEAFGHACADLFAADADTRPTAALVSSLIAAQGLRRGLAERGLKVPEDVSIVTYDDVIASLPNPGTPPAMSVVSFPVAELASQLATALLNRIEAADTAPSPTSPPPVLVKGASTQKP